jgi:hypothetical protein
MKKGESDVGKDFIMEKLLLLFRLSRAYSYGSRQL